MFNAGLIAEVQILCRKKLKIQVIHKLYPGLYEFLGGKFR